MTDIGRNPRGCKARARLVNIDTIPTELARTLRRELGELRLAHLARAIAELAPNKPEMLIARKAWDEIWRPI